jgi:hypothetical protein
MSGDKQNQLKSPEGVGAGANQGFVKLRVLERHRFGYFSRAHLKAAMSKSSMKIADRPFACRPSSLRLSRISDRSKTAVKN